MDGEAAVIEFWKDLSGMDRIALRLAWRKAFKADAPLYLSLPFMRKVLIWHEQTRRFGGVSPSVKRALNAAGGGNDVSQVTGTMRPGSQLVREWNGRRYLVDVTETGFAMDGVSYKSLSAIALHITGTNWSGPRFFGLQTRKSASA